ncbi:MAG: secretion protein, partial [Actinomyces sp.]
MNVANVRVTLVDDGGRTDVAVAAGTPVRALLEARTGAAVPDDVRVSTTTGAPAPLNSLIGQDLGSGTVLLVGGRVTGRHAADRLVIRSASRPVRPALDAAAVVLVACLLLALGWYSALTVGEARLPLPARAGAAGLAAALLAARAILANNRLTPVQ